MNGFDDLDRIAVVLDRAGRIARVNDAWMQRGLARGLASPGQWIGASYLDLALFAADAGVEGAGPTARALEAVLAGRRERAEVGYACDSPDEPAWKTVAIHRLEGRGALLVHFDTPDPRELHASERRLALITFRRIMGIETRCAWCRRLATAGGPWVSRDPAAGVSVTDGMCADCETTLLTTLGEVEPALA